MQYVIIGAGPAGIIAAETLRKEDPESTITVIGRESEPPYSRMAIPYYLIEKVGEEGTWLRPDTGHFTAQDIRVVQQQVEEIDTRGKSIALDNSDTLGYDKLLIATGSHPVSPPIPGIDLPQVQSCWTLDDAREIAKRAGKGANVVLMGAGFIGCIVLEALSLRGVNLTVVETGDRMVPRMLNEKAGNMLKEWTESKGVTVHTDTSVEAITADEGSDTVTVALSNGETLTADLVISATGVKPNTDFLGDTPVEVNNGIVVNTQMQTSQPDIYAAGDVAEGRDFSTGQYSVQAIQPTAADHGRIAALNMAGKTTEHQGSINMNVLDTLGLVTTSFGLWMGVDGGEASELYTPESFRYINLQFDGDRLVGASTAGMTQHVGAIRGLIQGKVRLGQWKARLMADPTRIMEAHVAKMLSF